MRILYNNILTTDVLLGQLLLSGYNDENSLTSQQLADSVRTTVTSTVTFEWDLGASPDTYNAAGLAGINLTSSATIQVKTGTTSGFVSPTNTFTLTGDTEKYSSFGSNLTDRYIRFEITDTGNTDGFLQFGRFMIGEEYDFPNFGLNVTVNYIPYGTSRLSQSVQLYGIQKFTQKQLILTFPDIDSTENQELYALINSVGFSKAFMVQSNEAGYFMGKDTFHMRWEDDIRSFTLDNTLRFTTQATLTEVF